MPKGFFKLALFISCLIGLGLIADQFEFAKEFARTRYFAAIVMLLIAAMVLYSWLRIIAQYARQEGRQQVQHKRRLLNNDQKSA